MDKTQEVAKKWFHIDWENKDTTALAEVISPEHPVGLDAIRTSFKELYKEFPDLRATIADQIVQGDKVVTRLSVNATYKAKHHTWTAIYIHQILDGKIANVWRLRDSPEVSIPQNIVR